MCLILICEDDHLGIDDVITTISAFDDLCTIFLAKSVYLAFTIYSATSPTSLS
ncbi:hypothetical protein LguiA_017313 [Lonicera macranthoides]